MSRGSVPMICVPRLLWILAVAGSLTGGLGVAVTPAAAQEANPAAREEASRVDALEQELEALRAELARLQGADDVARTEERLAELERRLELLAEELERLQLGEAAAIADRAERGFGPAASKVYRTGQGLSLGGYGEMLYESFAGSRDDGTPAGKTDQLDFLRAIVYFGYKFDDKWLFNSEVEFEHATTSGGVGEVSVELAYLEYLHRPELSLRTGMLLVPMGFLNELHEPTVFLGAKRPVTEQVIIPSTWRENGLGIAGEAGPVSYRSYLVNGLEASGFSAGGLRGGRQKGGKALAEDFAWVSRIDYAPRPGLVLGGSLYLGDSGQGITGGGQTLGVGTTIWEAHAEWQWQGLELRGLWASAELDDVAALNAALGLTGNRSVGEELEGGYLQAGYDVLRRSGQGWQLTPYLRWEEVNTQAAVPGGFRANPATDQEILTLGIDFKPLPQVVFKADWQDFDNAAGTGIDQFNVAVGYIF